MRILVIEDSVVANTLISRELNNAGYQVHLAMSGEEGVNRFTSLAPDLITVDVGLPDIDGFEVVRRIRAKEATHAFSPDGLRQAPVVFLTANDSLEARERGFAAGAADFVLKPFAPGELRSIVDRLLRPESEYVGRSALVVDDNFLARAVVAGCLQSFGLTVMEAANGEDALKLARKHRSTLDVVVADYMMPGMRGGELCKYIKSLPGLREIPVIAISAASEHVDVLQLFRLGVTDYVVKPFVKEVLSARVASHLRARLLMRQMSQAVDDLKRLYDVNSRLLAFVSHDLKSPVAGIIGMAAMLQEEELSTKDRLELARRIELSGGSLLQLIKTLTDLGKLTLESAEVPLELQPLRAIVDAAVTSLASLAERKGITLVVEAPKGLQPIPIHTESLIRVATNLISNAIKFTNPGGSVRVSIVDNGDKGQQLAVADTGIGMEASFLDELWSPSEKATRIGTAGEKGTGLGMRIVRSLVENLGGTLNIESEVGIGTTVTVTFPKVGRQNMFVGGAIA